MAIYFAPMEKTIEEINAIMAQLDNWGLLKGLTDGDVNSLRQRLHVLAGCAVMESQRSTQDLLHNMYNKIKKN